MSLTWTIFTAPCWVFVEVRLISAPFSSIYFEEFENEAVVGIVAVVVVDDISDVTMSTMASQITGAASRFFAQPFVQVKIKENITANTPNI